MSLKVYRFQDIAAMQSFLNGLVVAGKISAGGLPLEGKTLTFTQPAAVTYTFLATADGHFHTLKDIQTALEAAVAGLKVGFRDGALTFSAAPSSVIITGGTAAPILGIGAGGISGKVYGAPGDAAPSLAAAYMEGNSHIVVAKE